MLEFGACANMHVINMNMTCILNELKSMLFGF